MPDRLAGLLLFLPVPIVLVLFTQAPIGIAPSLAVGVALMVTHRSYARPFALARAARRCLWCGRRVSDGPTLELEEPAGKTLWRACVAPHADRARQFLGWAGDHGRFLQIGILGTLAAFLLAAVVVASSHAGPVRYPDAVNAFRLGIAAAVLPLGLLYRRHSATNGPLRAPFPVHIQALIGTWAVSWLFRIVGLVWLALAVAYFARRA